MATYMVIYNLGDEILSFSNMVEYNLVGKTYFRYGEKRHLPLQCLNWIIPKL